MAEKNEVEKKEATGMMAQIDAVKAKYPDHIVARVYTRKVSMRDGGDFTSYKILETKTHRKVDLRFVRALDNAEGVEVPTEDCIIVVKRNMINKDAGRDFPCYWVRGLVAVEPLIFEKADPADFFD